MEKQSYRLADHLKFLVPSLLGIFLFMTPVSTDDGMTIPIAVMAGWIETLLAGQLSAIMMVIIIVTAVMTVIAKVKGPDAFQRTPFFQQLFYTSTFGW